MTGNELFEVGKALMESQRLDSMTKEELIRARDLAREMLYDFERGRIQIDEQTYQSTELALYEFRDRLKTLELKELETK